MKAQCGRRMGSFHVDCEVVNARRPAKSVRAPKLLVDTGSEFSWISQPILREAGIRVAKKDLRLLMASGQTITRSTGYARFPAGCCASAEKTVARSIVTSRRRPIFLLIIFILLLSSASRLAPVFT